MRLVCIGHDGARFEDVCLNFTDRTGSPTNSVIWLRNGGGKTSLLSLFFAGIRPHQRDFLGKRTKHDIRGIDDYVGPRDHGVVVCEWSLDADRNLFDDNAPRYLSGVFYEQSSSHKGNGNSSVDRLFFGFTIPPDIHELTLEGLPLLSDSPSGRTRRNLNGFRRRMRELQREHPAIEVFLSESQNNFAEELSSRGIDPDVFYYQILMNEREGGVSERFSFAQDEEFVDLLLEMAFDARRARDVHDQLGTFRQELVERNDKLKPELEYCRGLIARLEKLAAVEKERAAVYRDLSSHRARLAALTLWVAEKLEALCAEQVNLETNLRDAQTGFKDSLGAADRASRLAAVFHRQACQLRFDAANSEYEVSHQAYIAAQRRKHIWSSARPLARANEARRRAKQLRDQLARKLQEFAPELAELTNTATRLFNALNHEAIALRADERKQRSEAESFKQQATTARDAAEALGESAATSEAEVKRIGDLLGRADKELQHLRQVGSLLESDPTPVEAAQRLVQALAELEADHSDQQALLTAKTEAKSELATELTSADQSIRQLERESLDLGSAWQRANERREKLEADAALLRLLQTDKVDVQAAIARAVDTASEELRRITDTILRVRLEAAEELRAMHWLEGDGALLPPSKDVEALLGWLRAGRISCWSGWEYIERNVQEKDRRQLVQRLPYVATGVIVANSQYDLVIDLVQSSLQSNALRLSAPVAIMPADAISDSHELTWTIVGPTSDAHFHKDAAAVELNALRSGETRRQSELSGYESWREDLSALQHRLRAFQSEYPSGWFAQQRQLIDLCQSRLEEAAQNRARFEQQIETLKAELDDISKAISNLVLRRGETQRHQDRIDSYLRQYGEQVPQWRRESDDAQTNARLFRLQQGKQKELSEQLSTAWANADRAADETGQRAGRSEEEKAKLKFVDTDQQRPEAGLIETLRADYNAQLDNYLDKVNADALSQMAESKDREADDEQQEFLRVVARFEGISAANVESELAQLDGSMTAERRSEQADDDERDVFQKLGTAAIRRGPAEKELTEAKAACESLEKTAPLPEVKLHRSVAPNEVAVEQYKKEADEHTQLAKEFDSEISGFTERLTTIRHEYGMLDKDSTTLASFATNNQEQFQRLDEYLAGKALETPSLALTARVRDANDLARQLNSLESSFQSVRGRQQDLDGCRESIAGDIGNWSRVERFTKLATSISHRFSARRPIELESKAAFFITQLKDAEFQIEEKLKEANVHHDRVVNIVLAAVDEGLDLLKQVSSMSKLPESLPQAGKQFLIIETKASESPAERRARVADLIDELLQTGDIGKDDVALIQKAVRRVAGRMKVRVLHPDLHHGTKRLSISDMRALSGGERLTSAILLYCALVRLRSSEKSRRGSGVLILDNPIGTASRQSFLDLQREVARSMDMQLIYATGVKDLSAVGALENVIRLRNTRADKRTGKRLVELDGQTDAVGNIAAARVTFDSPASSLAGRDGRKNQPETANNEPQRTAHHD
jgi:hypothetical protein